MRIFGHGFAHPPRPTAAPYPLRRRPPGPPPTRHPGPGPHPGRDRRPLPARVLAGRRGRGPPDVRPHPVHGRRRLHLLALRREPDARLLELERLGRGTGRGLQQPAVRVPAVVPALLGLPAELFFKLSRSACWPGTSWSCTASRSRASRSCCSRLCASQSLVLRAPVFGVGDGGVRAAAGRAVRDALHARTPGPDRARPGDRRWRSASPRACCTRSSPRSGPRT